MQTSLHVVPHGTGWDVIHEGARYAESHHATQDEAIQAGTGLARRQKVELLIHGVDGKIHERDSYGHDPREVAG